MVLLSSWLKLANHSSSFSKLPFRHMKALICVASSLDFQQLVDSLRSIWAARTVEIRDAVVTRLAIPCSHLRSGLNPRQPRFGGFKPLQDRKRLKALALVKDCEAAFA